MWGTFHKFATPLVHPLRTGNLSGKLIILLLLFLVREKLSVYVHNCVIDDVSILKFLLLMKLVFYAL